ncbi:hypothetical protein ACQBAU_17660 [Propionibacteriaceae bacterium Y2011]
MGTNLAVETRTLQQAWGYYFFLGDDSVRLPAFIEEHCPITLYDSGLLSAHLHGHPAFASELHSAAGRVPTLLKGVASAFQATAAAYQNNEADAAVQAAMLFPEARIADPTPEAAGPMQVQTQLTGHDDKFPDWWNPSQALVEPSGEAPGVDGALDRLNDLLGAVPGSLADEFLGFIGLGPTDIAKKVVGDWDRLHHCGLALHAVVDYHAQLSVLIRDAGVATTSGWSGIGADRAEAYLASLANAMETQCVKLPQFADGCLNTANAWKTLVDALTVLVEGIVGLVAVLMALLSSAGIALPAGAGLVVTAARVGPAGVAIANTLTMLFTAVLSTLGAGANLVATLSGTLTEALTYEYPAYRITLPDIAGDPDELPPYPSELL